MSYTKDHKPRFKITPLIYMPKNLYTPKSRILQEVRGKSPSNLSVHSVLFLVS